MMFNAAISSRVYPRCATQWAPVAYGTAASHDPNPPIVIEFVETPVTEAPPGWMGAWRAMLVSKGRHLTLFPAHLRRR